ncbi:MAG: hypothetical protein OCD01_07215 [Fibrobacterales bacterium]
MIEGQMNRVMKGAIVLAFSCIGCSQSMDSDDTSSQSESASQGASQIAEHLLVSSEGDLFESSYVTSESSEESSENTSSALSSLNDLSSSESSAEMSSVYSSYKKENSSAALSSSLSMSSSIAEVSSSSITYEVHMYCPVVESYERVTNVQVVDQGGMDLVEISGTAVSTTQNNAGAELIWVHNDSGGGPRVSAISATTGERIRSYRLSGVGDTDYEDIALAPCGNSEGSCIYLADVGDNQGRESQGWNGRSSVYIYKFKEPIIDQTNDNDLISDITVLEMRYSGGDHDTPVADCEAIFVDPAGDSVGGEAGDIYLVTKWNYEDASNTRLLQYPLSEQKDGAYVLKVVSENINHFLVTRSDISSDGTRIAVGNYDTTWFWSRAPDQTIANAFDAGTCELELALPASKECTQFEALAFSTEGDALFEISEQTNCTAIGIHKTTFTH